MTVFGRTGTKWGFEHFPIKPDVLYGGKGLLISLIGVVGAVACLLVVTFAQLAIVAVGR